MEYAIISAGVIVNIVVSNDQGFIDEFYPGSPRIDQISPKPGIGWTWNGAAFVMEAAPAPLAAPAPPQWIFTTQQFRRRYTLDELIAVDNFAEFPGITDADRQKMLTITTSVTSADSIDLLNPNVIDAVNFEAQIGLITAARAAEILNPASAPPTKAWTF